MHAYLKHLQDRGGYIVLMDNYFEKGNILSVTINGCVIYPCFQFAQNSFDVQMEQVSHLLSLIKTNVSNLRKVNFFIQKFNDNEMLYEVLRRGVEPYEWDRMIIMAKNFGTNNLT